MWAVFGGWIDAGPGPATVPWRNLNPRPPAARRLARNQPEEFSCSPRIGPEVSAPAPMVAAISSHWALRRVSSRGQARKTRNPAPPCCFLGGRPPISRCTYTGKKKKKKKGRSPRCGRGGGGGVAGCKPGIRLRSGPPGEARHPIPPVAGTAPPAKTDPRPWKVVAFDAWSSYRPLRPRRP